MKVVALCGSLRSGSTTQRALQIALDGAQKSGADTQLLLLRDLDLPLCDGRADEQSYGKDTPKLKAWVREGDALLVGSPEYHGSLSGALKNALDLLGPEHLSGTLVGLLATGRKDAGAMNTLNHLRHICRWMDAWVLPQQSGIAQAQHAFSTKGEVLREGLEAELHALGSELVRYASLLKGND